MSIHKSLKSAAGLVRARNVLKREERLARLGELNRWSEDKDSIFHLPKTRIALTKSLGKKKKKKKEGEEGGKKEEGKEGAPAAAAAAPAAPAKGKEK
jgi:small basic protein (TIGR04137 family)